MIYQCKRCARIISDRIANAFVEKHAFYVISHERSGTHFLINTLNRNMPIRVGWGVGYGAGHGWNNIGEWFGPYENPDARYDHIDRYNEKMWVKGEARNAVIKSHADASLFNSRFRRAPVVYVYRDPRDVMVSWYHYLNDPIFYAYNPQVKDLRCDQFSVFLRRPLSDFLQSCYSNLDGFENVVDRWASHVSGWFKQEGVCMVSFSELKNDAAGVVAKVSDYLGIPANDRRESVTLQKSRSILPRKGVEGDWKNFCSAEDLDFIDHYLARYGLSLPLSI